MPRSASNNYANKNKRINITLRQRNGDLIRKEFRGFSDISIKNKLRFLIYTYLKLDVNNIRGEGTELTDEDKEEIITDVEKIKNGDFTEEDEYKYSFKVFEQSGKSHWHRFHRQLKNVDRELEHGILHRPTPATDPVRSGRGTSRRRSVVPLAAEEEEEDEEEDEEEEEEDLMKTLTDDVELPFNLTEPEFDNDGNPLAEDEMGSQGGTKRKRRRHRRKHTKKRKSKQHKKSRKGRKKNRRTRR
tara:strand:+ start:977 stop:1708 length:732 start_codon:yes stop_codon:yes gene_type:complete